MIMQIQTLEQPTTRPATDVHTEVNARLYKSIPDLVGYIQNPDYLCPGTEKTLFGPEAPAVSLPQWKPSGEFDGEAIRRIVSPPTLTGVSHRNRDDVPERQIRGV